MFSLFTTYLLAHFLAYVTLLRHSARLRTERGVFLYHLVPAMVAGLAGLAFVFAGSAPSRFAELVLVLSVQGIYSISFLELWSLAQGGYSLSILRSVARSEGNGVDPDFSRLKWIGETKQRERIVGLERLGLIVVTDRIALTRRGKRIAFLLHSLLEWVDPRKDGSEAA